MNKLKRENKVLKYILNNNSKNNNIKFNDSSKIKLNHSIDLWKIREKIHGRTVITNLIKNYLNKCMIFLSKNILQ